MQDVSLSGKSLMVIPLLACLVCAAVAAGCMGTSAGPEATVSAHTTYSPAGPQPSLSASVTAPEKHFRTDASCYWAVTGTVTNTGNAPARNVVIRFMLVDDESGMIRATESIFAPRFQAGETKIFTVDPLPGDCGREYHAEIAVTHDIP